MKVGGDCLKYPKKRWSRKERRGNKDVKKGGGGKLAQELGALKKGAGTPLQTMVLKFSIKLVYYHHSFLENILPVFINSHSKGLLTLNLLKKQFTEKNGNESSIKRSDLHLMSF